MSDSGYFDALPVELIVDILAELDLQSLVSTSYACRRLLEITRSPTINPWRIPILRAIHAPVYEPALASLSVRHAIPHHNWLEIMSIARPELLLFHCTPPHLGNSAYEEIFKRRFLPSWSVWKKDGTWKELFMKMLYRTWHRANSSCTTDESWTKYIVLNRNGTANLLEISSRNYNSPVHIFNTIKLQNNLTNLPTSIRVVAELADVRILALGTRHVPRSQFAVNHNAPLLLNPPGLPIPPGDEHDIDGISVTGVQEESAGARALVDDLGLYQRLTHPAPAVSFSNYPFYTPGGSDCRWEGSQDVDARWVGSMMITAQIITPCIRETSANRHLLQDLDLIQGPGRSQYASLSWQDLFAIAPWMRERITKLIDGPGLGH